jgi:phage-related minor tail protein
MPGLCQSHESRLERIESLASDLPPQLAVLGEQVRAGFGQLAEHFDQLKERVGRLETGQAEHYAEMQVLLQAKKAMSWTGRILLGFAIAAGGAFAASVGSWLFGVFSHG